ncbi:MAG: isoprenylcysteine carboxylmethyltransferase family protein [Candidatus Micrarchaeia archaeon]|jgi:protein-S-isoprenylcysteine O-methyltransferase Ste14
MADGQTYFIILLILSILLSFAFPAPAALYAPYMYFGAIIIGFGLVMALWGRALFLKGKTTLSPYEVPTSLVTDGPFRISRNPMYLGMASILLGVAVLLGTWAAFVFPVLFVMTIGALFIPNEERKLEKIFGEKYGKYKKKVRRWL